MQDNSKKIKPRVSSKCVLSVMGKLPHLIYSTYLILTEGSKKEGHICMQSPCCRGKRYSIALAQRAEHHDLLTRHCAQCKVAVCASMPFCAPSLSLSIIMHAERCACADRGPTQHIHKEPLKGRTRATHCQTLHEREGGIHTLLDYSTCINSCTSLLHMEVSSKLGIVIQYPFFTKSIFKLS